MQVRRRYKGIHNMLLSDHQRNLVRNVYTVFSDFHHIRPLLRKVLVFFVYMIIFVFFLSSLLFMIWLCLH